MNIKLRIITTGVLFFTGQYAIAQKKPVDSAKETKIEEVVLVGFGQKKSVKEVTGSIGTIKGDKLNDLPVSSPDKALMGRVTGIQTGAASGQPGGFVNIRVRGNTSVNGNNNPIFIVDGVRIASGDLTSLNTTSNILANLNSDDIESMTVLKDAVSTSLYGADAGAGVIIITTKSGKTGKPKFSFSTNSGINKVAFKLADPLTKEQWLGLSARTLFNTPTSGFTSVDQAYQAIIDPQQDVLGYAAYMGNNTDWRKELTRNATQGETNFAVSGGNEKFKYYSSLGLFNQQSIYRGSDFKRVNASTKIEYKATDRLTINTDFQFSNSKTRTLSDGGNFANPILAQYFNLPIDPVRNADGSWYFGINNSLPSGNFNVAALQDLNSNKANTTRIFANLGVNYKVVKGLVYRLNFAPEYINIEEDRYLSPLHGDGYNSKGDLTSNSRRIFNFNIQNIFEYSFNVGDKNRFVARAIQEAYKSDSRLVGAQGQVVALSSFQTLDNFVKPVGAIGKKEITSRSGYAGQLNYNFANIFNLDLAYRRDALSNFFPGQKAGNFYSAGASVDLAEIFIPDNNYLTMLKLRSSYGKLGNQIPASPYATYSYTINYNNNAGAGYAGFNNPGLKWETVKPFNIGVDMGFLKDRITVTAEYYNKKTEDLIFTVPLSLSQGLAGYTDNIGTLVNKGFEFNINADIFRPSNKKGFALSMDANFSTLDNKLTKIYGGKDIISPTTILREGESINSWYMRKWAGVDPNNGDPLWYVNGVDGETTNDYNKAQRAIQGNRLAKYFGGVGLKMSYQNFTLSAQGTYSFGGKVYDNWANYTMSDGQYNLFYPGYVDQLDYWTPDNPNALNPKPIRGGNKLSNRSSSRFLYKADYLRLSNIKLAYTFDSNFLKGSNLNKVTIYVMGNNIWTYAYDKNLRYDPDTALTGNTDLNLPPLKSYLVGFNVEF
ncbi:SusC/RagA family TonB-linked outer membrane protein [Chryseobacterium nematophagum]|uniref:SusC/RagA family TonB-linked outer membrane protein n=1 Tax=Chryseobacterium nematophagum TaxID=2305228 RepID=A0A3M7TE99_9FLAO|nr:SusC/RagA family TonB-linked outer membrane protein [Chryseobacterium nematophagum]RNA61841.1 SusC/RagA family TonB-linked outer membrane protein [Chryseobacterium nematophagum]